MQSSPPDTQSRVDSAPTSPPSPPDVTQPDPNPFSALLEDPDLDTVPYPYPRYTDGPDAESHIRAFVSTWQATRRNDSLLPKSSHPKLRNSHYTSMDRPLDGIRASTWGRLQRSRTFERSFSNYSTAKFRSACHEHIPKPHDS